MAYPDGREIVPNFLHADLASRLADEAARTAMRMQNICIRALDYCPPVDITFGDYLRALVTADRDTAAEDSVGYRASFINAFRSRGIRPSGVLSYSEEALSWDPYEGTLASDVNPDFKKLWRSVNEYEDQPTAGNLKQLYSRLWGKAYTFRSQLGLDPDLEEVQVQSLNTLHRVAPDGSMQRHISAVLVQRRSELIDPADSAAGTFTFRGGTTLIINREGEVRFSITKSIVGPKSKERLAQQRAYLQQMSASSALAPYVAFASDKAFTFQGIHRGY
jgi:hypothetical protein